jgi:hypothetical protein
MIMIGGFAASAPIPVLLIPDADAPSVAGLVEEGIFLLRYAAAEAQAQSAAASRKIRGSSALDAGDRQLI